MVKLPVPADQVSPSDPRRLGSILRQAAAPSLQAAKSDELSRAPEGESLEDRRTRKERLAVERVRANAPVNLFTPVFLNACHKHTAGVEMTDLETDFFSLVRAAEFSDDDVRAYGQIYDDLTPDERKALFPEAVAGLTAGGDFTYKDAAAAVSTLSGPVLDLPNVASVAGADALNDGEPTDRHEVQRYGWSRLFIDSPQDQTGSEEASEVPASPFAPDYFLEARELQCVHQAYSGFEAEGDDEVYFVVHYATADFYYASKPSPYFEGFKKGVTKDVKYNLAWQDFDKTTTISVQAWEEDYGKDKVREELAKHLEKIGQSLQDASKHFDPKYKAATVAKIVGVIAGVIAIILNALDDDYIGTDVEVITPADAIERAKEDAKPVWLTLVQHDKNGNEEWGMGKYYLSTRISKNKKS